MLRMIVCATLLVHAVPTQLIAATQQNQKPMYQTSFPQTNATALRMASMSVEDEMGNRIKRDTGSVIKGANIDANEDSQRRGNDADGRSPVTSEDDWQYREARGAIKDQWIKQPYPIYMTNIQERSYRDNIPSPTDNRGRRVNFVTQGRLEDDRESGVFEREGRMIRPTKPAANDVPLTREEPRTRTRDIYFRDRPKYDDNYHIRFPIDRYYRYEDPHYNRHERYFPGDYQKYRPQGTHRQKRIIYYATLPEVVRSPPNVNLRNRYEYRDRFDDLYPQVSPSFFRDPYPYRTPYNYDEDLPRAKEPYPLKVSTDLNVRETNKNPEKRIYSEADPRYAYKTSSYRVAKVADHLTQD